jgi:hypothetical protein
MARHGATIEFRESNANATNVLTSQIGRLRVDPRTFLQRLLCVVGRFGARCQALPYSEVGKSSDETRGEE